MRNIVQNYEEQILEGSTVVGCNLIAMKAKSKVKNRD